MPSQGNLLDVTADGALEKVHGHPRLEVLRRTFGCTVGMRGQVVVETVRKGIAELL
jgi:hypothetical protein